MEFRGKKIHLNIGGYPFILQKKKMKFIHVLIWEERNGLKPKGFNIHHKDKNICNWNISNLELVERKKHSQDHKREDFGWLKENGVWIAKPCSKCKQLKLLENFGIKDKQGHLRSFCRPCKKDIDKEYREKQLKNIK